MHANAPTCGRCHLRVPRGTPPAASGLKPRAPPDGQAGARSSPHASTPARDTPSWRSRMRWKRLLVMEPTARGTASLPRGDLRFAFHVEHGGPPPPCAARSSRASRQPLSRSTWNMVDRLTHARPVHPGTAPDLSPCSTWNVLDRLASSRPAPSGPLAGPPSTFHGNHGGLPRPCAVAPSGRPARRPSTFRVEHRGLTRACAACSARHRAQDFPPRSAWSIASRLAQVPPAQLGPMTDLPPR